jgi:hypothetical protein
MKNAVFWDIKPQSVPHRRHMSPLQIPVIFEVFTAVTMRNAVFWDIKTAVLTSQETSLLWYRT